MIDVIIPATNKPEVHQVLQHLLNLDEAFNQVIIVDFDKSAPSLNAAQVNQFGSALRLQYVFVNGQKYFNKSIAINTGFDLVESDYVLICDADVLLDKDFFTLAKCYWREHAQAQVMFSPRYVAESATGETRPGPGICLLKSADFARIAGYSSDYIGWGMEDMDFLKRLEYAGIRQELIAHAIHLSHSDEVRTRNYYSNSVQDMRLKNRKLFKEKHENKPRYGTLPHDSKHVSCEVLTW
ncbi:glycosyltransferase family 2 protein [Thalassomonas viridans]|uniref:Glycosyltransferase family 2 protein n=1 Tax=Thalassomonas viridans TaxID=137584 RepID=A0AAE9Z322_9GAMM|nr:glycosyltransferase family A protein [Thalassomonas viridans]WDE05710.1 glycosyltransferase family 2 protein [Thalassomonas viridans]